MSQLPIVNLGQPDCVICGRPAMTRKDTLDGPFYWCSGCGTTLEVTTDEYSRIESAYWHYPTLHAAAAFAPNPEQKPSWPAQWLANWQPEPEAEVLPNNDPMP